MRVTFKNNKNYSFKKHFIRDDVLPYCRFSKSVINPNTKIEQHKAHLLNYKFEDNELSIDQKREQFYNDPDILSKIAIIMEKFLDKFGKDSYFFNYCDKEMWYYLYLNVGEFLFYSEEIDYSIKKFQFEIKYIEHNVNKRDITPENDNVLIKTLNCFIVNQQKSTVLPSNTKTIHFVFENVFNHKSYIIKNLLKFNAEIIIFAEQNNVDVHHVLKHRINKKVFANGVFN